MESVLGYSRKNPNRGVEGMLFWKRPLEFLDLSLYPEISLFNFTNMKFRFFFLLTPGISTLYFFSNNPGNSMSSTAPVWIFSGIALCKLVRRKKIQLYIYSKRRNGCSYSWLSTTQNSKRDQVIIRMKHKICSRQWKFELSNVNFWRFRPVETSGMFDFWNVFNKGLHGVRSFEYSNYLQSIVFRNFPNFLLKF